ncbi:MAG TPA: alpha/beta hydrolase, partial [Candidatus Nanopelagicales bacterium]
MRWPVEDGMLHGDIPYLRLGQGPPLVIAAGISLEHTLTGMERRLGIAISRPYAQHFTVTYASRPQGLAQGTTMADLAAALAAAIEHDLGGASVMLLGSSTGGSVSLQLAIDRPDLVRRLVLLSSACRLSEHGRTTQREVAEQARHDDPRKAYAHMMADIAPKPVRGAVAAMLATQLPGTPPVDPGDLIATILAEDAFDAEPHLARITAPTLVIGGGRDTFYSPELFRRTADGVRDGRVHIWPGKGHAATIGGSQSPSAFMALGFLLAE